MGEVTYRKRPTSIQSSFLSAGHIPTANCSLSFVRASKGPQSRRKIRERKQNFRYVIRPSVVARRLVSEAEQRELDLREVLGFSWSVPSVDAV